MKILIIGLGSIAKKHILALKSILEDFEIFALRSGTNNETQIPQVKNIFSLEEKIDFDFALISNPTYLHAEYIKMLLQEGIPLMIEKPAVHKLSDAQDILKITSTFTTLTYTACNLRFHPCLIFLKNYIENNKPQINEVNIYCGSYLPEWRDNKDFRKIYSAEKDKGGGVHLDLYHELDYCVWLFGKPLTFSSFKTSKSSLKIDAVDYANFSLSYEEFCASIILNYYRRDPKREIEILTEDATIKANLISNTIEKDNKTIASFDDFTIQKTYEKQLEYFLNCLKNGISPMNNFEESLEVLNICLKNEQ